MFSFSLGVLRIGDQLPKAVYALLSGFNAATVGIIALAAVQLSRKVISDKFSRALVFLGGACGMLYTALWYFPVLMAAAGVAAITWDLKVIQKLTILFNPPEGRARHAVKLDDSRTRTDSPPAPTFSDAFSTTSS